MRTFKDFIINENYVTESKKDNNTIFDFIKHQLNIDLEKFHLSEYDKKGYITIDWDKLSRNEQNQIKMLNDKYDKLIITDYGNWGKWIKLKK